MIEVDSKWHCANCQERQRGDLTCAVQWECNLKLKTDIRVIAATAMDTKRYQQSPEMPRGKEWILFYGLWQEWGQLTLTFALLVLPPNLDENISAVLGYQLSDNVMGSPKIYMKKSLSKCPVASFPQCLLSDVLAKHSGIPQFGRKKMVS